MREASGSPVEGGLKNGFEMKKLCQKNTPDRSYLSGSSASSGGLG